MDTGAIHRSRPLAPGFNKSGANACVCRAGFQPAVSPTSSRQACLRFKNGNAFDGQRVGNPRYSRLEACATGAPARSPLVLCRLVLFSTLLIPFLSSAQTNDAISREISVFNLGQPGPGYEAISREVSVFNLGQPGPSYEAISREVSVFNLAQPTPAYEAISREVSVFNLAQPTPSYEAISREVSVFNLAQPGPKFEAISREVSVFGTTNALPDLIATILSAPASAMAGRTVQVVFEITNTGAVTAAAPWTNQIVLSPDAAGLYAQSLAVLAETDSLAAGASITVTQSVALPNVFGAYFLGVSVDSAGNVQEYHEDNNLALTNISITYPPLPDLVASGLSTTNTALAGQLVTIYWLVTNAGNATATAPWQETILLADNAAGSNAVPLFTLAVSASLFSSNGVGRSQALILPSGLSGAYWLVVQVDSANQVFEGYGETNNVTVAAQPILIQSPDLQVQTISAPSSTNFGQAFSVSWAVTNSGNGPALASWKDRLWLSSASNSLSGALLLAEVAAPAPLSAGAGYALNATVTVPLTANSQPGAYWLVAQADASGSQPESNEGNNLLSRPLTLALPPLPDLVPGNLAAPGSALSGQSVMLTWAVTNAGGAAISNATWTEAIYLLPDAGLDPTNVQAQLSFASAIASFFSTNTLAAGDVLLRTQAVHIPITSAAATTRFVVWVDSGGTVIEASETNNTALATNATIIPAQLALQLPYSQLQEGAAMSGIVFRNCDTTSALQVTLTNDNANEIAFSLSQTTSVATVSIPAGAASASFPVRALDDGVVDGSKLVNISATASNYLPASVSVTVLDVEVPSLSLIISNATVLEGTSVGALIARDYVTTNPVTVYLQSSIPARLFAPASVTIPGGASSTAISLQALDNTTIEAPTLVTLTATAGGFNSGSASVTIIDNDTPGVTLSFAQTNISEGAGPQATVGTVSRYPLGLVDMVVALQSSDPSRVEVPPFVTILGGQSNASFFVSAIDNSIADGPHVVTITPSILTETNGTTVAVAPPVDLTVLDDDGPTLKLAIAKKLVPEGQNPATSATVTRNTPATNALTVLLTSSDTNEATVPISIVIPQNQASASFNIVSINDGVTDGNKTVIIRASADQFTSGSDTLVVSDINLPDLVVTDITAPATVDTEAYFNIGYRVVNQGVASAATNFLTRIFLTSDPTAGNNTLVGQYTFNGTIPPGQSFTQTLQLPAPSVAGAYWVVVSTDVGNSIAEVLEDNNTTISSSPVLVRAAYGASIQADLHTAVAGTPVPMHGHATNSVGGAAQFKLVNIFIGLRGTTRIISALTDASGNFSTTWQPLQNEAGHYTLGADYPGAATTAVQDQFTLYGFKADPSAQSVTVADKSTVVGTLSLINQSEVPLSGLAANIINQPANVTATANINTNVLVGNGTNTLVYTITASDASTPGGTVLVRITSAEGATVDIPLAITFQALRPVLVAYPDTIYAGMARGKQTLIAFDLVNQGAATSGPVTVSVPSAMWLSLACTNPLASLAPGQTNRITLQLTPANDLVLGPYTGSLALNSSNASTTVPFNFQCLSESKGDLLVSVVDEYTYFAVGAPPVTNAVVTVKDAVSMLVITNGTVDSSGKFSVPGLTEGYYQIEARSDKHSTYTGQQLVLAGRMNEVLAFESRQTVQYTWTVQPIQIEDRTQITIETTFETVVPVPVITLDPPLIDLRYQIVDSIQVNMTVANHGLIAANQASFYFSDDPEYEIQPVVSDLGTLPAQSSVTVPVIIRKKPPGPARKADNGGPCIIEGGLRWTEFCGEIRTYYVPTRVLPPRLCDFTIYTPPPPPPSPPPTDPQNCCTDPGGRPIGPPTAFQPIDLCDPCLQKRLEASVKCAAKFIPCISVDCWYKCLESGSKCVNGFRSGLTWNGGFNCAKTFFNCAKAAGKNVPWPWKYVKYYECTCDIIHACRGMPGHPDPPWICRPFISPSAATKSWSKAPGFSAEDVGVTRLAVLGGRLQDFIAPTVYTFGDDIWFQDEDPDNYEAWVETFVAYIDSATAAGEMISDDERAQLLAMPLPAGVTVSNAIAFIDRWNRTLTYWQAGIFRTGDVPVGQSTDFIDVDIWAALANQALEAEGASAADGIEDPALALYQEMLAFNASLIGSGGGGTCARVKLQLEQDAVITRDAFSATLIVDNGTSDDLQMVGVDLKISDQNGTDQTSLFAVAPRTLTGIAAIDGTGTIVSGSSASMSWTIVPGLAAAPNAPLDYTVTGQLRYVQGGLEVNLPLGPTVIHVLPSPALSIHYFHQRDVYADDPFTPLVEPSIPFNLAVMVQNTGAGIAKNFSITSAQPQIVDNQKGLLINFKIIATEVSGQNMLPSLTANFGDINPGQIDIGRWLMTSTLQGLFIDYSATFQHTDALGGTKTSLIDDVSIHEMIHLVQAQGAFEDGKPDFLVNDIPDPNDYPDTLYMSDGSTNPVSVVTSGTLIGAVSGGSLVVTQSAAMPPGWVYLRVPDPGHGAYALTRAVRSDGVEIYFNTNVWTTDRTFIGMGRPPIYENILHLLDYNSTGSYTLYYAAPPPPDTNAPASAVAALPTNSYPGFTLNWNGADTGGGSGLAFFDIYASDNGGPFLPWLQHTTARSAFYVGSYGHTYSFYSRATDVAGNVEPAPAVPQATTTVNRTNSAPTFGALATLTIDEGQTLVFDLPVTDPDGDAMDFALAGSPPIGATLNPVTGRLTWPTTEATGPSTNVFTFVATDHGFPSLSSTGTLQVIVNEVNSAPVLQAVTNRTIGEGFHLAITNVATDSDIPANILTFRLGPNPPRGASINASNGVFSWTPDSTQGPSTNTITVIVTDNGQPPLSATQQFVVIVRDSLPDFTLNIGSTNLFAGETGLVPLTLTSTLDLTNLGVQFGTDTSRLTNFFLESLAPEVTSATLQALNSTGYVADFALDPTLQSAAQRSLAMLGFLAVTTQHSAIVRIEVAPPTAQRANGQPVLATSGQGGRVVIVATEPVLEISPAMRLTFYGHPGSNYLMQYTTNLVVSPWQTFRNATVDSRVIEITNAPTLDPQGFYRAFEY
ncbi:MAG: hypothetical protein C5B50_12210 [Verrucomicrobia bacterium]|nr:MAG: hypothetical protein C5B50_12210 [Verrucomicrobiota bacterium]